MARLSTHGIKCYVMELPGNIHIIGLFSKTGQHDEV